ncbi:hypothetical protein SAMN04487902_11210 [Prevotella sp. ne3005]|uniref:PqqD family protein n=1 Tax=Prevotella sp. ne3005 TaxID=1761887 RepID=UPI0008CA3ED7|nr:PqqD family protein [Prevotella sp. ne3005]SEN32961.1 hypothetical protein SAMN04487902_11210 [Prevotella sp. ne3005]
MNKYYFSHDVLLHQMKDEFVFFKIINNIIDISEIVFVSDIVANFYKYNRDSIFTIDEFTNFICSEYEVSFSTAKRDVEDIVSKLEETKIIICE